jgi:copper(I)-binding protein
MKFFGLIFLFVVILPANSMAAEGLTFREAWTVPYAEKATPEYHIYGIMSNLTPQNDVLLRAETPVAHQVIFENSLSVPREGQQQTMARVNSMEIPAEQVIFYDPGRVRLTLKRPVKTLKIGDTFPLTLIFRDAGPVKALVEVKRCCEEDRDTGDSNAQ